MLSCILRSLLNYVFSLSAYLAENMAARVNSTKGVCVCVCVCVRVCSSEAAACTELYEHVALCLVLRASRVPISTRRLMCGATFVAVSAVLLVCDPSYRCFEGAQRLHLHGRADQILDPEYEGSTYLRNAGNH
jgi:hypothetical protein